MTAGVLNHLLSELSSNPDVVNRITARLLLSPEPNRIDPPEPGIAMLDRPALVAPEAMFPFADATAMVFTGHRHLRNGS